MDVISPAVACEKVIAALHSILSHRQAVLAIPGGRSAQSVLSELGKHKIPWNKVHVFFVDERKVPQDHELSNYASNMKVLTQVPKENIHFCTDSETYGKELDSLGGKFDVTLVGVGEDGHIASLFPGREDLVHTTETGFMDVENAPKAPSNRISATPNLLLKSQYTFVFFMGPSKAEAYNMFLDTSVSELQCPAKILRKLDNLVIVTNLP